MFWIHQKKCTNESEIYIIYTYLSGLPWIFPGAPLKVISVLENIQVNMIPLYQKQRLLQTLSQDNR